VGVILPVLMLSAVVLTANHFVLDAVVGGTFALAGLTLSTVVTPRWSPWLTRPAHQRGSPPWRSATASERGSE
jgi:hypothetical protein